MNAVASLGARLTCCLNRKDTCTADVPDEHRGGDFCPNPKESADDVKFCSEHTPRRCAAQGCGSQIEGQLPYCPKHTCRIDGCQSFAAQYRFCDVHYPCGVRGCQRFRRSTMAFCRHHACDYSPQCLRPAEVGQRCREHVPCASEDCRELKAPGKIFCARHNCTVDGCVNERARGRRCEEHLPCGKEGCERFQIRDRDGDGMAGYCDKRKPSSFSFLLRSRDCSERC